MTLQPRQFLALMAAAAVLGAVGLGQRLLGQAQPGETTGKPGNAGEMRTDWNLAESGLAESGLAESDLAEIEPESADGANGRANGRGDVRIVVISDLNSAYGSTTYEPEVAQAIALIPGWNPDLVLAGGDMVAGQKRELSNAQVLAMWESFDRVIRKPLEEAEIPFGFTIGNHDGSGAQRSGELWFWRDRNLASNYWNGVNPALPFVDRAQFPFYYSFVQDGVFYLVWDASTAELGEQQLNWVEAQLGSEVAQAAKARIVIGHLPLYPVAVKRDRIGEFLNSPKQLQQLLIQHDVHTYISGHNHAYYPGLHGELELLNAGALGGGPRQLLGSEAEPFKALTVVDLFLAAQPRTVYQTYRLPEMTLVDIATLPAQIVSDYGTVTRRDLKEAVVETAR